VAAVFEGRSLTYGELDQRSNKLARYLVARGVLPGTRVAVCVRPALDIQIALLAIFKAGGVYVPLDPSHPEAYQARILDDAQPAIVLTQSKLSTLPSLARFDKLCFDADWALVEGMSPEAPAVEVTLNHPSHLLYTSGTTGRPKGVLATHANLAHYVHVARKIYGFRSDDIFCSLARYTFSISLFELVSPLCCGAAIRLLTRDDVLAPDRLTETLREVTVVHAGPSLLGSLFQYLRSNPSLPRSFPNIRHASSGGDLVPPHLLEEMKQVFENAELFVIYGCTEVSCMGTTYPVSRLAKVGRTFVGKPFPDVAVRVVDGQGNLVPIGVVGEICFAGKGVVPGYLDQPGLTAEKFAEVAGRRFYQTGDLGRLHSDGNLEILGRRDFQVQLRGIRIELVGIENAIREARLAVQCAVVVKRLSDDDARLVAFVVGPREATIAGFRRALSAHLPDYMLPQHLAVLEALPLTANGKLDRRQLQDAPWEPPSASKDNLAVGNAVERKVAGAFARALGVTEVGLDDDFFDIGGHSLLAVKVAQDLENELGLSCPAAVLFEHTTVRRLAAYTQDPSLSVPQPILLSQRGDRLPLFMIAGVHLYRGLARHLEGRYSVYGVYSSRELLLFESQDQSPSIAAAARDYIEIIRRRQPKGPYRVAGMSFGGIIVYEIAQQLRAAGEEVVFLGLLDAILPEPKVTAQLGRLRRLLSLPRRDVLRVVGDRLRARVQAAFGAPRVARYSKHAGDDQLRALENKREDAYAAAAVAYPGMIRHYPDAVTLVVAGERRREELGSADCGWGPYAPRLEVHTVDAGHLALLEEPHVGAVARIFLDGLDRPVSVVSSAPEDPIS
jgi:amino acid adenylation domain-containing protein